MNVIPDIRCLPDMVRAWSGKTPNKAALIDGGRVVTYTQLNSRSNRIANTLAASGIRPGSHVGFLGKNSAAFFEIWVGVNTHADMPVDVSDLVSHCRFLIAGYKVPKEIHLTDALPQTASGKVQKAALRQQLRGEQP